MRRRLLGGGKRGGGTHDRIRKLASVPEDWRRHRFVSIYRRRANVAVAVNVEAGRVLDCVDCAFDPIRDHGARLAACLANVSVHIQIETCCILDSVDRAFKPIPKATSRSRSWRLVAHLVARVDVLLVARIRDFEAVPSVSTIWKQVRATVAIEVWRARLHARPRPHSLIAPPWCPFVVCQTKHGVSANQLMPTPARKPELSRSG